MKKSVALICGIAFIAGCEVELDDGPIAEGISGALGEPIAASAEQLQAFERGRDVLTRRFDLSDGLGPAFNLTFCGGCHEDPVFGGSAGLYRNFFLAGYHASDGTFLFTDSAGDAGGVQRVFSYSESLGLRPAVSSRATVFAQRNPIPFFGVGLLAEIDSSEILSRADPDDEDGDGISGRPNFEFGLVGRFGRKSQTTSLESFIRGPLFNHMGVTSNPLTDEQRSQLPIDQSLSAKRWTRSVRPSIRGSHQAAAPEANTRDDDAVADPEISGTDLVDLISFVMLLSAPEFESPTEQSNRGRLLFHEANCSACHTPRLQGPRGPIPAYSDLLLHDMGSELADGIVMGEATGSEFRTQPLWGISATGPYLHDGRARTIEEAILAHGGEAASSQREYAAFSEQQRADVLEFLMTLGGRSQTTPGLLEPDAPVPDVGEYGGPLRELNEEEQALFVKGRDVFDRDFGLSEGVGALAGSDGAGRFNGDSCRACHFDPVIGGAGPRGVNVMRHGSYIDGTFANPEGLPNSILHKHTQIGQPLVQPGDDVNVFEHRQTPAAFGLGLVDAISEETILSNEDPLDADEDGISGRAHILAGDGRVGRLGWKADVPNVPEFVRDAMAAEIGLTIAAQDGLSFGLTSDDDDVSDPELSLEDAEALAFYLSMLAAPPRNATSEDEDVARGEALFSSIGCARCHIQSLPSSLGDVPLYSDLLLHDVSPQDQAGIASGDATATEFRTAPLWGLSQTAPYMHDGSADTVDQAIRLHDGEAVEIIEAYDNLEDADREALLSFLSSL